MNANPKVDPGPRIPRQIAAQAAHARKLLGEDQEDPNPEVTPAAETAPPPSAPTPVVFTAEELLKAPDKERDQSRDYWFARSQAVEGFRRTENARSKETIAQLRTQVQELSAKVEELSSKQPTPQPAIDLKQHFTEDEIDSIGEERAQAILRAAMNSTESIVRQRIDAAIKPLIDKKAAEEQETEEQRHAKFIEDLTAGFPTWQITDKDPRWLKWLTGVDESTGMIRQRLVNIHKQDRNADGIVKLLNSFVASLSPASVPAAPPETPAAITGGSSDAPPPVDPVFTEGRMLTSEEIKAGYKRKSLGKMSREEAQRFDAQVAAQMRQQGRS